MRCFSLARTRVSPKLRQASARNISISFASEVELNQEMAPVVILWPFELGRMVAFCCSRRGSLFLRLDFDLVLHSWRISGQPVTRCPQPCTPRGAFDCPWVEHC